MNLKDFIINTNCSYYPPLKDDKSLLNNPTKFIQDILKAGGKQNKLVDKLYDTEAGQYRLFHTASIYSLGIMLYYNVSNLKNSIDEYIKNGINAYLDTPDEQFLYNWFQLCFLHDVGYAVVKNKSNDIIFWDCSCKTYIINKVREKILKFSNRQSTVIPVAVKRNLLNYDEYKRNRDDGEFVDHGFLAGAFYYDDRKLNFENKLKAGELEIFDAANKIYIDPVTNTIWSKDILENIQAGISEMIIGHNVFYAEKGTGRQKIYENFKLNSLVISRPIYESKQYPLFFLLQLVDTIDLFKYVGDKSSNNYKHCEVYKKICNDIEFEFCDDGFKINLNKLGNAIRNKFYGEMNKQLYWLPIKISKHDEIIEIRFQ